MTSAKPFPALFTQRKKPSVLSKISDLIFLNTAHASHLLGYALLGGAEPDR